MKTESRPKDTLDKLIHFITFVDMPIRKKFTLFSIGVLFWFTLMFAISITVNIDIDSKTDKIANQVTPLERASHKIIRTLDGLSIDAAELTVITDVKTFNQKIEESKTRITDIRTIASVLSINGDADKNYRDHNIIIEQPAALRNSVSLGVKKYSDDLLRLINRMDAKLTEIRDLKTGVPGGASQDNPGLAKKIEEYKQTVLKAASLSDEFSADVVKLYVLNSEKIKKAIELTFYTYVVVLLIATALLIVFTISISKSIAEPVKSMISQIRSLGEGEVDLSKKIEIRSKDEIGVLSDDFNTLMEEIRDMSNFKKVIEEDDSLEDVYSRLGRAFSDQFGLDEFIIYEVSGSQKEMKPVYPVMLNYSGIFCDEEILSNCDLCKVKKTGHTVSSITYPGICRPFKTGHEKTHVCIPMIVGGKVGGVVQFLFDKKYAGADRKDKRIFKAEQYIRESVSVIEAKRLMNKLRESALKDSLTELYNRRFLQEYMETLVAGVIRRKKNIGLIMSDLDFFKQVNDTYGHNVGDSVLRETANVIKKCVRSSDLVIRFGGEEYLVLMLDVNEGETLRVAEKIREAMENTKLTVTEGTIKKTISAGVSEFPADSESFWQAIKFADVALYKAKETGRNKVVRFTKDMWNEEQF